MDSVRRWAAGSGWDYRFIGDEIFASVPSWFSEKLKGYLVPISDLARLEAIERLFEGDDRERIIWIDADLLIFSPERFQIPESSGPYLVEELWIEPKQRVAELEVERKVNNSVMVWDRGDPELKTFQDETLDAVRKQENPGKLDAGTNLLTARQFVYPVQLLRCVGCFGPPVIQDLIVGGGPALSLLSEAGGTSLGGANLCRSLGELEGPVKEVSDAEFCDAVDVLLGPDNPLQQRRFRR